MADPSQPKQLRYSEEVRFQGVSGQEVQGRFLPKNGNVFTYNRNRIAKFEVSAQGMLSCKESYLKFRINNNSASDVEVSGTAGAHGCFSRYVTKLDNKIVDDVWDYALTMATLSDLKMSKNHRDSFGKISGYASSQVLSSNPLKDVAGDYRAGTRTSYEGITETVRAGQSRQFCIPLQGILASSKYVPLSFLQSLEFELHLHNALNAFTSDGPVDDDDIEYSNFEYVSDIIEMDVENMLRVESLLMQTGITLNANTWKVAQYHANTTNGYVFPIPEKWSSIKSLLVTQRNADNVYGVNSLLDKNHRIYDGVSSYQLKVGSKQVPQNPIEVTPSSTEPIIQCLKALGMSAHDYTTDSTVDLTNFYLTDDQILFAPVGAPDSASYDLNPQAYDALPKQSGKFVMAFDLETYSENEKILSGLNNNERNLPLTMDIKRNGFVDNVLVNTMCLIDQQITLKMDPVSRVVEIKISN